jgi:flagellar biosynthesis/type III secretory pathway chaperone
MPEDAAVQLETYLQRLEDAIATETAVFEELKRTGDTKKRAMVALDLPGLNEATQAETRLLERIELSETVRRETTKALCGMLMVETGDNEIGRICQKIGEPHRSRLASLRDTLKRTLREVLRSNRVSHDLAEQSLQHRNALLMVLVGAAEPTVYSRKGVDPSKNAPMRNFVNQVA